MRVKEQKEIFSLSHYRLRDDFKGEIVKSLALIPLTLLQAFVFGVVMSSININTLLPWYSNRHTTRICMICASFIMLTAQKLLRRSHSISLERCFLLLLASHLLFSYYFISLKGFLQSGSIYVFPLSKLRVHANLLFFLANSLAFSLFFTFVDYFIKSRAVYTQAPGLFAYLRSNIGTILSRTRTVALWSAKLSFGAFCAYVCVIHTMLSLVLAILRISLFYRSVGELLFSMFTLFLNSTFFYVAYLVLDYIIIFNVSFGSSSVEYSPGPQLEKDSSYSKRQALDALLLQFHRIAVSYRNKELTFKTGPKEAGIVASVASEVYGELREIQQLFEACRSSLDSEMFVTVPQVNRRCTKRYKTYHMLGLLFNRPYYRLQCLVLSVRFLMVCSSLVGIFELVEMARNQENVQLVSDGVVNGIVEAVNEISNETAAGMRDDQAVRLINKLR